MNDPEQPTNPQQTSVSTEVPATPTSPPEPPKTESTEAKKPSKKSHLWLYIIIVVIVIIAALGTWYGVHKSNNQSSTTKKDIPLITYGFDNNPLNVFYPSAAEFGGPMVMNEQIFEGLVSFTNGTQIVPDLATSWTNPNTDTWIFTLRPNTYYHDGDVVTAQDVVYSWQQLNAQDQNLASYTTSTIKNVQATNNNTVEITTTAPDPVLLNRLTNLYIIDSKAPKGTQPWELGTGAYTVKSGTTPTANAIDLVAFNKWHGGHIYTRAINYIFYANSSDAVSALISGKVNLVDSVQPADMTKIKKYSNLTVTETPPVETTYLAFNTLTANSPLANPKIREAIDLTLNPADILKAEGPDSGTAIDQVLPPQIPGYNQSIVRPAINLTEAKQLVLAAYPNGVTINLGNSPTGEVAGQEIVNELAPIGITVKQDVANSEGEYFGDIANGTYQTFFETYGSSISDGSDVLSYWQNAPFYDNPTFDAEVTKADQTFDPAQRLADLQQASQTLISDNAIIPLYQNSYYTASKKGFVFPIGTYDSDLDTFFSTAYQQ